MSATEEGSREAPKAKGKVTEGRRDTCWVGLLPGGKWSPQQGSGNGLPRLGGESEGAVREALGAVTTVPVTCWGVGSHCMTDCVFVCVCEGAIAQAGGRRPGVACSAPPLARGPPIPPQRQQGQGFEAGIGSQVVPYLALLMSPPPHTPPGADSKQLLRVSARLQLRPEPVSQRPQLCKRGSAQRGHHVCQIPGFR